MFDIALHARQHRALHAAAKECSLSVYDAVVLLTLAAREITSAELLDELGLPENETANRRTIARFIRSGLVVGPRMRGRHRPIRLTPAGILLADMLYSRVERQWAVLERTEVAA